MGRDRCAYAVYERAVNGGVAAAVVQGDTVVAVVAVEFDVAAAVAAKELFCACRNIACVYFAVPIAAATVFDYLKFVAAVELPLEHVLRTVVGVERN